MILETASVGIVIPVITLLTSDNLLKQHTFLKVIFNAWETNQIVVAGMLGLVLFYIAKTVFLNYFIWYQNKYSTDIQESLSYRLFDKYLSSPWQFHLHRNSSRLIQNISQEVVLFADALKSIIAVFIEGLVLLGVMTLLLVAEPLGTLTVLCVLSAITFGFHCFMKNKLNLWGRERHLYEGLNLQYLQQGLSGAKEIKLLGRESYFLSSYKKIIGKIAILKRRQLVMGEIPRLWLELLAVVGISLLVMVMIARGKSLNSLLPILALFAVAAFRMMPSINRILGATHRVRYLVPTIKMISQDIKNDVLKVGKVENSVEFVFNSELVLKSICFYYQKSSKQILSDINIVIKKGSLVGLFGVSGGGKSTIVDIILGLLTPQSGEVLVDGRSVQDNLRAWQDKIGYVPQNIFLTDDSLRRNIAFGISDTLIDDSEVHRAVKSAQLEEFINDLPEGLDTIVGERGIRLSGGQRQRIGIARALYHNPLVLVFDEATSALDLVTEAEVMKSINGLRGQKTLIMVAHRISTLANCDWLYKIKNGKIVYEGNFETMGNTYKVTAE